MRTVLTAGSVATSACCLAAPGLPLLAANGGFETVYDWSKQKCEQWDIPDAPTRAFRDDHDIIVLFASDDDNRPFTGRSLTRLTHVCQRALPSERNADAAKRSGARFIAATWTNDGRMVAALIHNEYNAEKFPGRCRFTGGMQCWYNSIVAAASSDGGRHFTTHHPPALVAGPAFRQEVDQGRHRGFFNPSNIVRMGGAYYFLANTTGGGSQKPGVCLFRTTTPLVPTSWRGLAAKGYGYRAMDPYAPRTASSPPCEPVGLANGPGSISYHRPSGRFVAVMTFGAAWDAPGGSVRYSWSADLVRWSEAKILLRLPILGSQSCADTARYAYPSLLDPQGGSRNFDVIGSQPYLFLTEMKISGCKESADRNLVRLAVRISG